MSHLNKRADMLASSVECSVCNHKLSWHVQHTLGGQRVVVGCFYGVDLPSTYGVATQVPCGCKYLLDCIFEESIL